MPSACPTTRSCAARYSGSEAGTTRSSTTTASTFAMWCKTGKSVSLQVETAREALVKVLEITVKTLQEYQRLQEAKQLAAKGNSLVPETTSPDRTRSQ